MMRRIDLLPSVYEQRRRQRRNVTSVLIAGLLALLLLLGWWFFLGMQVNDAEDELAQVRTENAALQDQIAKLQRFAQLAAEVEAKRTALQTVFAGDVDWPALMTEIAMVIPGEVWLTNVTASAGQTEGASPVGTETAPVRIDSREPFGRIAFTGRSLSMPGVAKWMLRLETVREFFAVYLNSATKADDATGVDVVNFDSTLELGNKAASGRFQGRIR
ncbi:MAG: PilN domain-containing protein [Actinomycetota bacterium]|nr:PilN domain-containing protein [Actinomycetota bacterium]